ncbi:hypothetical protein Achl_4130 (plasmid) [Pseudarthrobacter chlorophenolicus A6]|uniref:Uncharacterized protein n=1 Tax=Pseudarthrobacter chlorophenolicus (strain ATCC 700700 / DSM 12829 / CIP 107037 / JCM 12360 / KCTC 9906 / NCIMB 13794 / A6) TaxID=452863 RepID=B8HI34_PSECP|nr:hypothetical protein [Pseudarthrobacter chlorophenolicus]ACL42081.1 hypothetical protein Achl_4130 [Pseudarthrobacter chlorophenolicus A6]SDQ13165.1 hypothetical protein SAMN04489738_0189 [Pseudarthrobacter chlorophenolicus]SDQ21327.1 hypothetical protein SAMN04489738_0781 [Pseudarthrobacter chlorophenolicus]
MSQGKRAVARVAVAAGAVTLAAVLAAVGVRLWNVHLQTSDWTLTPREVPSKVQYDAREFNCGPDAKPRPGRTLDGLTVRGKTAGGADIYAAEPPPGDSVVTFISIRTADGVFVCDLMGGP